MATFVFTSPAINVATGQRGTLVLTDAEAPAPSGDGGGVLALTNGPTEACFDELWRMGGIRLADVESLEVTEGVTHNSQRRESRPTSVVTIYLRDGSTANYGLAGSYPALIRAIFMESGWGHLYRSHANALSQGS